MRGVKCAGGRRSGGEPEDERCSNGDDAEQAPEEAPCKQPSVRPDALRDPELAHKRCVSLSEFDGCVEEDDGADELKKWKTRPAYGQPLCTAREKNMGTHIYESRI
jgi:hypothetical protein